MNILDLVLNDPNLHPAFTLGVALHNPNVAAFDRQYLRRFLETPAPVSAFAELDSAQEQEDNGLILHSPSTKEKT